MAHKLYSQSNKNEKFVFVDCFNFLKTFDKWNPEPVKQVSETTLVRASSSSERPIGRKRAKISAKRNVPDSVEKQDELERFIAEMKSAHERSAVAADKRNQEIVKEMVAKREMAIMMADPKTIEEPNRRIWLEMQQAEILQRRRANLDFE